MVIPAEMRAKMFVGDSTGMFVVLYVIVPLFLANFFVIAVLVLGNDRNHSCRKAMPAQMVPTAANRFMLDLA